MSICLKFEICALLAFAAELKLELLILLLDLIDQYFTIVRGTLTFNLSII